MTALAFILFFHLGTAPIYILDEAKNAQCAREMLLRKDWIVPTFNGELRTDKPVLHYYFMALAYKTFGVNEFAARFFSALLGCLTVAITFFFTKRFTNASTAFFTSLVLAVSTHFLYEFRLSVPDPYLIFFIATGLFSAYTYLQEGKFKYIIIAAICFALATLAKGPVALALPGLCLLLWIVFKRKWKSLFNWKVVVAIALLLAIALPWYYAVDKATNGAWTRGFFIEHNLNRFSSPQEGHGGVFILPLFFVVIGLLPFTSFLGEVAKARKAVFTADYVKFAGLIVLAFVVFFSISSTKLPNYPMPCYPFVAIIIGHYLSLLVEGRYRFKVYPLLILLLVTIAIPIAGFYALSREPETANVKLLPMFLLPAAIALMLVLFAWKNLNNFKKVMGIAIAYSIFNILVLHTVYPIVYKQNPVAKTIAEVKKHPAVFSYKIYNAGYNFYLDKNVQKFFNVDTLQAALAQTPDAIIITRKENDEELKNLQLTKVAEHHDLFELPTTVLYVTGKK